MNKNVRNILRTGDICELKDFEEETFAICIEGKLYIDLPNSTIYEVPDFDENVIRILRPNKIENALEMWRYANEGTWRAFISPPTGSDNFKTVYIKDKPVGLNLNILEKDLTYSDHTTLGCIQSVIDYTSNLNLSLLWDLINTSIRPLICNEYTLMYLSNYIYINRNSDQKHIAEIIEMLEEG